VTNVARTVYESSRSSGGSQSRNIADQVIQKNPEVQSVIYVGSEIYLYRDTLKGQMSRAIARANMGVNAHIKNEHIP
jgi:hypothetical protein